MVPSSTGNQNPTSGDLMEEQRKHAILLAAAILCAWRIQESMMSDSKIRSFQPLQQRALYVFGPRCRLSSSINP